MSNINLTLKEADEEQSKLFNILKVKIQSKKYVF